MNQEKLVILGSGESGVGAAILAKKQGFDVFLSDCNEINKDLQFLFENESISLEGGGHSIEKMKEQDIISALESAVSEFAAISLRTPQTENAFSS